MKHRSTLPLAPAALAAAILLAGAVAAGQAPTPAPEAVAAKVSSEQQAPKCADCHTELVKDFSSNPHARTPHGEKKADPNVICTTCHGDGARHMEAGGDASLIHTLKGVEGAQDCLTCHAKTTA
jgi:nitrate/TMAO reductase-like tetraheme cytochrome c subunit